MNPVHEHWDEIALAGACARGDAAAIAWFERRYGADVDRAVGRFARGPIPLADLRQIVMTKLFVAEADTGPRIARYSGAGTLAAWLRVAVVRTCIDALRLHRDPPRAIDVDDAGPWLAAAAGAGGIELDFFKRHYRGAFKRGFETAVATLSSRDRNLMKHISVGGLTQDQVAAIYGVHRVTAARWIGRAREAVVRATRKALLAELRVPDRELDSILRLVESHLELSLQRVFAAAESEP